MNNNIKITPRSAVVEQNINMFIEKNKPIDLSSNKNISILIDTNPKNNKIVHPIDNGKSTFIVRL